MIATWPDTLPHPERKTWNLQHQDARRKRQPESGPPGYRRRFSSAADFVSLSVVLTRAEKAVFDQFYRHDCAGGSRLFWMPDPTTDGWALLYTDGQPLLVDDSTPLLISATWLCAWGDEPPQESVVGQVEFRKTFQIVVMP